MIDLFILHAPADASFVKNELVRALAPNQVRLSSELPLGANIIGALEDAVATSRIIVVVVSPAFLGDMWAKFGEALASHLSITGGVLIPLVLVDCALPPRLDMRVRLDCRDPARRAHEFSRLRQHLSQPAPDPGLADALARPRVRIFLSYRHEGEEAALASRLRDALTARGHAVSVDSGMTMGTEWAQEIRRNITESDAFILLVSEGSIAREMVQDEVHTAYRWRRSAGKPMILPVRVRYTGPLDYETDACIGNLQHALWLGEDDDDDVLAHIDRAIANCPDPGLDRSADEPSAPSIMSGANGRPPTAQDPRFLATPGGAVTLQDPLYVRRACDDVVDRLATATGQTVVIKAPRQHGKTSLLVRYLSACQLQGKRIALIDFQRFEDVILENYPTFLRSLWIAISDSLGLDASGVVVNHQRHLHNFVKDIVLAPALSPIVLAFDEVDRIAGREYKENFFAMLRSWHNERAMPQNPRWAGLDLALVLSSEPDGLITDSRQSPFNVGERVEVLSFTPKQCRQLNDRYGERRQSVEVVDELYDYLGGHPYLIRFAFYLVQTERLSVPLDRRAGATPYGPFGDHLRALLSKLSVDCSLLKAMQDIIAGRAAAAALVDRLLSFGLIRFEGATVKAANQLYAIFFRSV